MATVQTAAQTVAQIAPTPPPSLIGFAKRRPSFELHHAPMATTCTPIALAAPTQAVATRARRLATSSAIKSAKRTPTARILAIRRATRSVSSPAATTIAIRKFAFAALKPSTIAERGAHMGARRETRRESGAQARRGFRSSSQLRGRRLRRSPCFGADRPPNENDRELQRRFLEHRTQTGHENGKVQVGECVVRPWGAVDGERDARCWLRRRQ